MSAIPELHCSNHQFAPADFHRALIFDDFLEKLGQDLAACDQGQREIERLAERRNSCQRSRSLTTSRSHNARTGTGSRGPSEKAIFVSMLRTSAWSMPNREAISA